MAWRRERRVLVDAGFECTSDFDWRLTRGGLVNKRIAEVRISVDGKQVWYRLEDDPARPRYEPSGKYMASVNDLAKMDATCAADYPWSCLTPDTCRAFGCVKSERQLAENSALAAELAERAAMWDMSSV